MGGESHFSSEATSQLEEMQRTLSKMERTILNQSLQMQQIMTQQGEQMNLIVESLTFARTRTCGFARAGAN
jgi:hypothetical protein